MYSPGVYGSEVSTSAAAQVATLQYRGDPVHRCCWWNVSLVLQRLQVGPEVCSSSIRIRAVIVRHTLQSDPVPYYFRLDWLVPYSNPFVIFETIHQHFTIFN